MKIKEVVGALERFAPLPLQEGFDNAGLQVGLTEAEVSGALLCLDVTETIVDEAISSGCNLIVSHHPLIFRALKRLVDADEVQKTVAKAIRNNITIVSMHTNIDNAKGGVNFKIAEKLGLEEVDFLEKKTLGDLEYGSGVIGKMQTAIDAREFVARLKDVFGVECAQCNSLINRKIKTVALCGGAGAFMLDEAIAKGADAFVTGEMHYHEFFGHENQIQIAVIGHFQSEQYTTEIFESIIKEACPGVITHVTKQNTNPIIYL